jgi:3-isopropylmalate/(R)-2-methylmalate dehydratase small subunit
MARAFVFGDDVDTDQIIPGRHLTADDDDHLAAYCMSGIDEGFADRFSPEDVLVAGTNFGCGSSREHAPVAIKAAGASAVVAESFARIFFRNAVNIGLPALEIPEVTAHVSDGDDLTLDLDAGTLANETTGETLSAGSAPPFVQELVDAGGLVAYGQALLREGDGDRPAPPY